MAVQVRNLIFIILIIFFCAVGFFFYKHVFAKDNPFNEQHIMDDGIIMNGAEMK